LAGFQGWSISTGLTGLKLGGLPRLVDFYWSYEDALKIGELPRLVQSLAKPASPSCDSHTVASEIGFRPFFFSCLCQRYAENSIYSTCQLIGHATSPTSPLRHAQELPNHGRVQLVFYAPFYASFQFRSRARFFALFKSSCSLRCV
jgi:hypothetical protein